MTTESRSGAQTDVEAELAKAETAELARYRVLSGFWAGVFALAVAAAVALAVNQMFNLGFFINYVMIDNRYLYLLVALLFPLVFLVFPPFRGSPMDRVPWYDQILAVLTFGVALYYVWNSNPILDQAWEYVAPTTAVYVSLVMWVLLIEIGRRTGGAAIFFITVVISLFPTYADRVP
ncbi:MAG: hypothetical protein ACK4QW_17960, partial [Alphaproteobacteria bacterium]